MVYFEKCTCIFRPDPYYFYASLRVSDYIVRSRATALRFPAKFDNGKSRRDANGRKKVSRLKNLTYELTVPFSLMANTRRNFSFASAFELATS